MDIDENDQTILGQILISTRDEGYKPGTPEFDKRKRQLQVAKCRELRGYTTCFECPANDSCDLYIQVRRDSKNI